MRRASANAATVAFVLAVAGLQGPGPGPATRGRDVSTAATSATRVTSSGRALRINEVLYWPRSEGAEYVELYNATQRRIDLSDWIIGNADLSFVSRLPETTLGPGRYVALAPTRPNAFHDSRDAVALYRGPPGARTIVDFVSYSHDRRRPRGVALDHAVRAGIWQKDAFFESVDLDTLKLEHPVLRGESIGRSENSVDTDRPRDWAPLGGIDALGTTRGKRNHARERIDFGSRTTTASARRAEPEPMKPWTVMVYMDARGADLVGPLQNEINQMIRAGSDANVNIVVQIASGNGSGRRFFVQRGRNLRDDATNVPAGAVNPGNPASLTAFINYATTNFPAERYAIVFVGHGKGWKGIMLSGDRLSMSELDTGLAALGRPFDSVFFHSCLMAMAEVAHQISDRAQSMVGSEEIFYDVFPWTAFINDLRANPSWSGRDFSEAAARHYAAGVAQCPGGGCDPATPRVTGRWTISAIDPTAVATTLSPRIDTLATALRNDVENVNGPDDPTDNSQVVLKLQAQRVAERYNDMNFKDLYHLGQLVKGLPLQAAAHAQPVLDALEVGAAGSAVFFEQHGPGRPNSHGLAIHFPDHETNPQVKNNPPFDHPNPADHVYASEPNPLLPRLAGANHPLVADAAFEFPGATSWDEFLFRYYEPVADACIRVPGGCVEEATFPVGSVVKVSGMGSSDTDGSPDDEIPDHKTGHKHWYWDFGVAADHPGPLPGYGGRAVLNCTDEDCDRDEVDDPDDDLDMQGRTVDFRCAEPGAFPLRLIVWDQHHDRPNHSLHYNLDDDVAAIVCEGKAADENVVAPGDDLHYTIALEGNPEIVGLAEAYIEDPLPAQVALAGDPTCSTGECFYDAESNSVRWFGTLAPGGVVIVEFDGSVVEDAGCDIDINNSADTFDGVEEEVFAASTRVRCS